MTLDAGDVLTSSKLRKPFTLLFQSQFGRYFYDILIIIVYHVNIIWWQLYWSCMLPKIPLPLLDKKYIIIYKP